MGHAILRDVKFNRTMFFSNTRGTNFTCSSKCAITSCGDHLTHLDLFWLYYFDFAGMWGGGGGGGCLRCREIRVSADLGNTHQRYACGGWKLKW